MRAIGELNVDCHSIARFDDQHPTINTLDRAAQTLIDLGQRIEEANRRAMAQPTIHLAAVVFMFRGPDFCS